MPTLLLLLLVLLTKISPRPSVEGIVKSPPPLTPGASPGSEPGVSADPPQCKALEPDEYKSHIGLYKFGLEFAFKAVTIFFLLASGVLTFGLAKPLFDPVKKALLVISFLVNIAMILGFGVTTYLWARLSWKVRGGVKWSEVCKKTDATWDEFAARLYSPSLTMMLSITTILFIIFSFLQGKIMAAHHIWFCTDCSSAKIMTYYIAKWFCLGCYLPLLP